MPANAETAYIKSTCRLEFVFPGKIARCLSLIASYLLLQNDYSLKQHLKSICVFPSENLKRDKHLEIKIE